MKCQNVGTLVQYLKIDPSFQYNINNYIKSITFTFYTEFYIPQSQFCCMSWWFSIFLPKFQHKQILTWLIELERWIACIYSNRDGAQRLFAHSWAFSCLGGPRNQFLLANWDCNASVIYFKANLWRKSGPIILLLGPTIQDNLHSMISKSSLLHKASQEMKCGCFEGWRISLCLFNQTFSILPAHKKPFSGEICTYKEWYVYFLVPQQ